MYRFPWCSVVYQLVGLVYTTHEFVVFGNYFWFQHITKFYFDFKVTILSRVDIIVMSLLSSHLWINKDFFRTNTDSPFFNFGFFSI